ncbi:hypothetical protein EUGRSUZ_F04052 [Eucalyptus grandis]|uniref:Uncharacterized protein n=2 Tax=Eucalyptus grandis TaxID=71139 RepID=A0ACC3KNB2_EUCGR|nr:hypothetical protein EUGRSUZ_F04052 [Eucalyptus grandis]
MWRLKIAEGEDGPYLYSTNNYVGRQTWEFDPEAGNAEERAEVAATYQHFYNHRHQVKPCSDLLWRMQVHNIRISEGEAVQADDLAGVGGGRGGDHVRQSVHRPEEDCPLLLRTAVMCVYITGHLNAVFPAEHRKEILRYLYNHQNGDGGWGFHIEGHSTMFCTALSYICMRILGEGPDGGQDNACTRARKWILDRGGIFGLFDWSGTNPMPPEFWILPSFLPMHPVVLTYINLDYFQIEKRGVFAERTRIWHWLIIEMATLPEFPLKYRKFQLLFRVTTFLLSYMETLSECPFLKDVAKMWCYCRTIYMPMSYLYGKRFVGPITPLVQQLREELHTQPYDMISWRKVCHLCAKAKPLLNRWPFNKLREKALQVTMKHIHYEDENSRYITMGCVEKVLCMLACWVEDPDSDYFKKHLARIPDYLWVAEDGMKMQSFGSQEWDTGFAIQALLASNMTEEIAPVLARGHDFIKKSQVKDNPSGDFKSMHRHISKGSWTFSDQDHGWQVSDCTAEGLKCCLLFSMMPPEIVGEKMEPEKLYDAVNILLSLQLLNPTEFFADIVIEHEYVECTSSAIQALVLFRKLYPGHRMKEIADFISNSVKYLENVQKPDGSWYGCWGVCFTYGSWFALGGLAAAGKTYSNCAAMRKGVAFLLRTQLQDGGWGESYLSCPKEEITGVFSRNCMLHYANYRNIYPLWALAEYCRRVPSPSTAL